MEILLEVPFPTSHEPCEEKLHDWKACEKWEMSLKGGFLIFKRSPSFRYAKWSQIGVGDHEGIPSF